MDPFLLRQLDWNTSTKNASLGDHWRIHLCSAVFVFVAFQLLQFLYPNTFVFLKLWISLAVGLFLGSTTGGAWQLFDKQRRAGTSGKMLLSQLLAGVLFSAVALSLFIPDLNAQEMELKKVRSLNENKIVDVSLNMNGKPPIRIKDPQLIALLVSSAQQAELFYPSHEGSINEFHLNILLSDGATLDYDGRVPERHRSDFSIRFRTSEIIFPKGGKWLESASLNAR